MDGGVNPFDLFPAAAPAAASYVEAKLLRLASHSAFEQAIREHAKAHNYPSSLSITPAILQDPVSRQVSGFRAARTLYVKQIHHHAFPYGVY